MSDDFLDDEPDDLDFEPPSPQSRAYRAAVRGRELGLIADDLDVALDRARALIAEGGREAALDAEARIAVAHGVLDDVVREVAAARSGEHSRYIDSAPLLAVLVDAQRVRLDLIRHTTDAKGTTP